MLSIFRVSPTFKPKVMVSAVTNNMDNITKSVDKIEFFVDMGGTNDINSLNILQFL